MDVQWTHFIKEERTMRKFSILLLLCTLMLCLAACGNQGTTDDDIVGDDWRTWGTIQDTGTLTHDGQMIDVCICITDTGADLYYDRAERSSTPPYSSRCPSTPPPAATRERTTAIWTATATATCRCPSTRTASM